MDGGYAFTYVGPNFTAIFVRIVNYLTKPLRQSNYVVLLPVIRIDGMRHQQCFGRYRWLWMAQLVVRWHRKPYRFELPFEIVTTATARQSVPWRVINWLDVASYRLVNHPSTLLGRY